MTWNLLEPSVGPAAAEAAAAGWAVLVKEAVANGRPDSSWLFYQGPGEQMWAYQVTTGQVRSSSTTCCQYAVMATMKSPPG